MGIKELALVVILGVLITSCNAKDKPTEIKSLDGGSSPVVSAGLQFLHEDLPIRLDASGRTITVQVKGSTHSADAYLFAVQFGSEGDGILDPGQTLKLTGPNSMPATDRGSFQFSGTGKPFREGHLHCDSGVRSLCSDIGAGTNEYTIELSNGAVTIEHFAIVGLRVRN